MTVQINYSVQENVGGNWRFVGKYYKSKIAAEDALMDRRENGWPIPMKVVKIYTLDHPLATSKNLRVLDMLEDGDIWADFADRTGMQYGPSP